jgi:hypothetical protein
MPFKIPEPIIEVSISLKPRHLHKEKLNSMLRITFLVGLLLAVHVQAGEVKLESGPQRVHLLELFTSQGCSSCPPAEAWMSKLKSEPGLWKDFVPLAFHVDYWDRLGWRDPFASKEWTTRQYQYSENWKTDSVYTPGLAFDGRELGVRIVPTPPSKKSGTLKLTLVAGKVVAEFVPADDAIKDVDLHVATLGFNLTTKVNAGENSGRDLKQDFVVLSLANQKMTSGKSEFDFKPDARTGAIAAWITAPNSIEPIQAVGGWLR